MSWVFRRPPDYRAKPSAIFALLAIASATSGAAAITITPTGTITGSGALAGSCAIGLTAESTASSANTSGSAAITITPIAVAAAVGEVTGTAAIVFANSGTMVGTVGYPTSQRFKPAKWYVQEVRYSRQLDKLVIFPFSESTGVSGQADIAFGGAGVLRGAGALAGVAATTITPTATLRGTGVMLGSAAITITPEGTGSETAQGDITGTAALAFSDVGALLASGRLAGVAANAFANTLQTGSVQPIAGTSGMVFTVAGAIRNLSATVIATPRNRTVYVNNRRRR